MRFMTYQSLEYILLSMSSTVCNMSKLDVGHQYDIAFVLVCNWLVNTTLSVTEHQWTNLRCK